MFSFQIVGNRFKYRLFSISNLSGFNKTSNYRLLSISLAQHCSNKCSFQMQQFAKAAAQQKQQQFRMFCLIQNSPNTASSMPALNVDKATTRNSIGKKEEAKRQQQLDETRKQAKLTKPRPIQTGAVNVQKLIAERFYPRKTTQETLIVRYQMGKSGWKFLDIEKGFGQTASNYAHILVPEDIFGFVRAMDKILEAVDANKKSIIEASTKSQGQIMLHIANTKGKNNDYLLKLHIVNNSVSVQMRTVPNEATRTGYKPKYIALSLHQFHWLRHAIAELLNGEKEVQQQLGKSPGYPNWLVNLDNSIRIELRKNRHNLQARQPQNKNDSVQRRNLLHNNRRNLQWKQSQNNFVRPAQRQHPQRVAPIQQKPLQPAQQMKKEVPSSSPSPSEDMSDQLLQLVFLQQQQLQKIQSAILKDQPMGGVGGAIAQKMGPDNTILMSDLLAQAPQPQSAIPKWNGNNNNVGYIRNWSDNRNWNNQGFRNDDQS